MLKHLLALLGAADACRFIAYCGIIAGAIQLRKLVQREEDYYGE